MSVSFRKALLTDVSGIAALIAESAWALCRSDYTDAQIAAALRSAWGVDTQLICDGTYWVAERGEALVACGGWSWRRTLFGGDAQVGRTAEVLDPARDAARIRAFFVHPGWARRGLGRELLWRCEQEASAHGFHALELMATLPGERLYRVCGFASLVARVFELPGKQTITFVPMRKARI